MNRRTFLGTIVALFVAPKPKMVYMPIGPDPNMGQKVAEAWEAVVRRDEEAWYRPHPAQIAFFERDDDVTY